MNKTEPIADARNKNDNDHCDEPQYTPPIPQQGILSQQILS